MKATLFTTNDWAQKEFMSASTDEERARNCFVRIGDDEALVSGWILVGTAEVTMNFLSRAECIVSVVKAIDEQVLEVEKQYENAIARLTERKQELLCLPAPSQEISND